MEALCPPSLSLPALWEAALALPSSGHLTPLLHRQAFSRDESPHGITLLIRTPTLMASM